MLGAANLADVLAQPLDDVSNQYAGAYVALQQCRCPDIVFCVHCSFGVVLLEIVTGDLFAYVSSLVQLFLGGVHC